MTGSRALEANQLIETAELWLDQRTRRTWLRDATPVVESVPCYQGVLRVKNQPITSVTSVRTRAAFPGAEWNVLAADADYFVEDGRIGKIRLSSWWWPGHWSYARMYEVTYVPEAITVVDARVETAVTDLVAFWLRPLVTGITGDIQSYRVGDDLQVTFRSGGMVLGVPDTILDMVANLGVKPLVAV